MAILEARTSEEDECGQGESNERLGEAIHGRLPKRSLIVLHQTARLVI